MTTYVGTDDFDLLETMKASADGTISLLSRHMERLAGSARFFGFACDLAAIQQAVSAEAAQQPASAMLRLLLSRSGKHQLQIRPVPSTNFSSVKCSSVTVDSSDPMLRHKTTARGIYERARSGCDERTDVILANERGQATETTIANIAVLREGRWVTPPVSCGLLPGTMRSQLLAEGQLVEGIVRVAGLIPGEPVRCFNAVRGVFEAEFREY